MFILKTTQFIFTFMCIYLSVYTSAQQVDLELGLVGKYCLDGDGVDLSPNENHGTLNNATSIADRFGTAGGAVYFTGNLSYLQIPNKNIFNSNYTYSFWYNVQSNPPNGTARIMLGVGGHVCDQTVNICNNYFNVYTGINAGGYYNPSSTYNATDGVTLPPTNQWNQIASVKTNDSIKLYINGKFIASAYAPSVPCYQGNDLGAKLGGRAGHPQFFNGKMDDLFIYSRALSDTEVKALYNLSNQFNFTLGPDQTIGLNDTLILTPSDTAEKYSWSTGDTTKTISITQPGIYWVDLQRKCASDRDSIVIDYGAKAKLGNDTSFCHGDSILIIPTEAKGDTFFWSTGDTAAQVWIKNPGVYYFTAKANAQTETDQIKISKITVDQPVLGNDTTICPGSVLTLDPGLTSNKILWNTGVDWATVSLYDSGTFSVIFSLGSCSAADTINISYPSSPHSFLPLDTFICENDSVLITNLNPNLSGYVWKDLATGVPRYLSQSGRYTLTYMNDGCTYENSIQVKTKLRPYDFDINDTIICPNSTLTLYYPVSNDQTLLWSSNSQLETATYNKSSTEWVQLNDSGCLFIDTFEVSNFEIIDFGLNLDTTICFESAFSVSFGSLPKFYNILWKDGDTSSTKSFLQSGSYSYEISSICSTATKTIKINYLDCFGIFIPNTFSPNGDNLNDTFSVKILNPQKFKLSIYNRWGELVFISLDPLEGWDGLYNGESLPDGVYIYIGDFITLAGERVTKKGTITLLH